MLIGEDVCLSTPRSRASSSLGCALELVSVRALACGHGTLGGAVRLPGAGFAGCGMVAWPGGTLAAPEPAPSTASCAALGVADDFVVFSDGAFHATQGAGTTITGRIAARGNVKLDGASAGPGVGDKSPTVITGASLT